MLKLFRIFQGCFTVQLSRFFAVLSQISFIILSKLLSFVKNFFYFLNSFLRIQKLFFAVFKSFVLSNSLFIIAFSQQFVNRFFYIFIVFCKKLTRKVKFHSFVEFNLTKIRSSKGGI